MLKEALFIGFPVDNKGVIHIPVPEPGGGVQCLGLFALRTPCKGLLLWDLLGNPWPHPQPVQRTGLGRRNRYSFRQNSNRRVMSSIPMTVLSLRGWGPLPIDPLLFLRLDLWGLM